MAQNDKKDNKGSVNELLNKISKNLKYIELLPGSKEPAHDLDKYIKDLNNISDAALLVPKNIVVVDFDSNKNLAEKILNIYPTVAVETPRGIHLYYKLPKNRNIKNSTRMITAVGIEADYKTGANNKKAMATIKQNGELRNITDNNITEIPELPFELYPIIKSKSSLDNMKEGEGRNDLLYKHILNIYDVVKGIKDESVLKIVKFINENIFSEKLPEKELTSLLHSAIKKLENKKSIMSIADVWDEKDKLDMFALADFIKEKLDVKLYNGILFFRHENGIDYIKNEENNLYREVMKYISLKSNQNKELKHQLELRADIIESQYFPIKLKNGFLIYDSEVIQKDIAFTPYLLKVNYNLNAYSQDVDDFLNFLTCDRKDLRNLMEEMLGCMLMTSGFPQKAFFLVANSGLNGKSTFLTMLSNFTGDASCALALDELQQRENLFTLQGKLVNLGDDIDASYVEKSRSFKTLVAGNEIMAKALYEMPIKLRNTATLIFSSNEMPTFKDKSGGVGRRVAIIPCDNRVEKIDVQIDKKLSTDTAKSYILNLALEGMRRIIENGGKLSESDTVNKSVENYLRENDSLLAFLESISYEIEDNKFSNVYERYEFYCEEEGFQQPYSKKKVSGRLKNLGFEMVQKKVGGINSKYIKKI